MGSTRLHLDLDRLALGVLMFDRMVLPTPSDASEADRWDAAGWDTTTQARVILKLDPFVYFAPWSEELRGHWRSEMERLKAIGQDTRDLAFQITPQTIAMKAWNDVVASAGPADQPRIQPIPVVWAADSRSVISSTGKAHAGASASSWHGSARSTQPYERVSAIQFSHELQQPVEESPEATLEAAVKLAHRADFQEARRALYTAEALAAAAELSVDDFATNLQQAAEEYARIVSEHQGGRRRRIIHRLVPTGTGEAAGFTGVPLLGAAVSWAAKKVLARALPLPPPPVPAHEEGAALAMVSEAMETAWATPGIRIAKR